jgi:hypothetical protein
VAALAVALGEQLGEEAIRDFWDRRTATGCGIPSDRLVKS